MRSTAKERMVRSPGLPPITSIDSVYQIESLVGDGKFTAVDALTLSVNAG